MTSRPGAARAVTIQVLGGGVEHHLGACYTGGRPDGSTLFLPGRGAGLFPTPFPPAVCRLIGSTKLRTPSPPGNGGRGISRPGKEIFKVGGPALVQFTENVVDH